MKKLLFLDDMRNPKEIYERDVEYDIEKDYEIVRSYTDFVEYIKNFGIPEFISFDHDLGWDYRCGLKTGFDCAKWLVDYCLDHNLGMCFEYYVHSANPVGKRNIEKLFECYEKYLAEEKKMGVKQCNRNNCYNIMCDRYSNKHGYVCDGCFEELVSSNLEIEEFMETEKGSNNYYNKERRENLEDIFELNE